MYTKGLLWHTKNFLSTIITQYVCTYIILKETKYTALFLFICKSGSRWRSKCWSWCVSEGSYVDGFFWGWVKVVLWVWSFEVGCWKSEFGGLCVFGCGYGCGCGLGCGSGWAGKIYKPWNFITSSSIWLLNKCSKGYRDSWIIYLFNQSLPFCWLVVKRWSLPILNVIYTNFQT